MLVFEKQNLVYFAVPKTGSTAFEAALEPKASIVYRHPPEFRHMSVQRYENSFGKFLARFNKITPERMAILRHPLDRMRSWYKYRQQPHMNNHRKSTRGVSFDTFLRGIVDRPEDHKEFGNQHWFSHNKHGELGIDHLFVIEDQDPILQFLQERFGFRPEFERRNVSPDIRADADPGLVQAFEARRPEEFALYRRVRDAGHMVSVVNRALPRNQ